MDCNMTSLTLIAIAGTAQIIAIVQIIKALREIDKLIASRSSRSESDLALMIAEAERKFGLSGGEPK